MSSKLAPWKARCGALLTGVAIFWSVAVSGTELPLPCASGACGATGPAVWVTAGNATAVYSGNTATINQSSDRAILNWASFNVGADGHVIFQQPGVGSVALNRIFQDSPSRIFGDIRANGEVYLINPNGILFGAHSTVNVAGLLASTLGMSNKVFNAGLLAPNFLQGLTKIPVLEWADFTTALKDQAPMPRLDANGAPVPSALVVENGASITASRGRVLLAGPTVSNAGNIQTPDGQIALAAGTKVYLQASTDLALRGLLVEVDGEGKAWNQVTGQLSAPLGNITLVGLGVNQDGRISATTSVAANGSVRLLARNTLFAGESLKPISASHGGTLELGPQSAITITPELTDLATAIDKDQKQLPSAIFLSGQQIFMHGAQITAPAGNLDVEARANPSGSITSGDPNSKIRIDQGASIDLSGSSLRLPMSNNLVRVELRANELADSPTQRNGVLRGQTVYVDRRIGAKIANVKDAIDAVPKSVGERTAMGGVAKFVSDGDVTVDPTASINVSGGAVTYDGGLIQTTQLIGSDGRTYDIGTADPLLTYAGVLNPTVKQTYDRWGVTTFVPVPGTAHFEPTYVQGAAAGSLQFAAPHLVLSGILKGTAINGPYQRSAANLNLGGLLTIGLPKDGPVPPTGLYIDYLSPSVKFVAQAAPVVISDSASFPGPATVELPIRYLGSGGFTRTQIYSNGLVTLPAGLPLDIAAGSLLSISAPRTELLSNVTALGGSINVNTVATAASQAAGSPPLGIVVGDAVALDVRGNWTNDTTAVGTDAPTSPTLTKGGSIDLQAPMGELVIGDYSQFHVGGGAWLQSTGVLSSGAGGSLTFKSGGALKLGTHVGIEGFGVVGAAGGAFSLDATRIKVIQGSLSGWAAAQRVDELNSPGSFFTVGAPLFSDYGFSSIHVGASGPATGSKGELDRHVFDVTPGTSIVATTQSLQLSGDSWARATGGGIRDFSQAVTLPDYLRSPMALSLGVFPLGRDKSSDTNGSSPLGQLTFSSGASLVADAGSSVTLSSPGGISMHGTLRAPGGAVMLQIPVPPDPNVDPGYRADQFIELGSDSLIDVHGVTLLTPNDAGLLFGSVLAGGSVWLLADRGSVLAQPHAQIDVSGTAAPLDLSNPWALSGYQKTLVSSAGGAINVRAAENISFLADLHGAAGVGTGVPSPGASLSFGFTRNNAGVPPSLIGTFPTASRVFQLTSDVGGDPVPLGYSGTAIFSANSLVQSGFDSLSVQADDRIELRSFLNLSLAQELRLDAPVIGVTGGGGVSLAAASVVLGNSGIAAAGATATPGSGSLAVSGDYVEILGSTVLQGVAHASLASTGDLQLRGVARGGGITPVISGDLSLTGDLRLAAARIYPTTETQFSIRALGAGRSVRLAQTAASPGTPLSVAGGVNIAADTIVNEGTLLAPFGTLSLNAGHDLTLGNGSLTSVSGDKTTFLFGQIQNGSQWKYEFGGRGLVTIIGVPARQIELTAPAISIAKSATVDLRGGGDLYAYEFTRGTGGTRDALASSGADSTPGLYAVLPSLRGQYAPYDPQEYFGSALQPGSSAYLSGVAGLPAGVYPLLPARYALLPGAFLVRAVTGFQDLSPGQSAALADGTAVTAGYLTFGNTGLGASRYSGFAVSSGSYGRALAAYQDTLASKFNFSLNVTQAAATAPAPAVPADAGRLSVVVGKILDAQGSVLSAAAERGRGATIEVSAIDLEVTAAPTAPSASGPVQIAGSVLQSWNAGQLLIGGRHRADGSSIDVFANSVIVDGGVKLQADQVALVASKSIDVKSGATIASSSGGSGTALKTLPGTIGVALTDPTTGAGLPGAALLAVSDLSSIYVQRSTPATAPAATISLASGSTLMSRGSFTADGSGAVVLGGSVKAAGARWSLAASNIAFVPNRVGSAGLELTPDSVANLQAANSVRLTSLGSIDFATPTSLGVTRLDGTPILNDLTLIGSSIRNTVPGNNVLLGAKALTLRGAGALDNSPATGGGQLGLVASQLNLGPNTIAVRGFQTNARVDGSVIARGDGGVTVDGDLAIAAARLTAENGSRSIISAPSGTIAISRIMPAATRAPPASLLGGDLTLNAKTIRDDGVIQVAGGLLALHASQQLSLGSGAVVDVGGIVVDAGGRTVGADGGAISLVSGGDLSAAAGAHLRVAGAGTANAGRISIAAAGAAAISAASLDGAAAPGGRGGAFQLGAGTLADSTGLQQRLEVGGFTEAQNIRVHSGNLGVGAASSMTARQVSLVADSGSIDVAGKITAGSAGLGSSIRLYGGQGVTLESGSTLQTDATGAARRGGNIELGTSSGVLSLATGSVVSARGSEMNGTLRLRSPAITGSGNDVAIAKLGSDVRGVGLVVVEPVLAPFSVGAAVTATDYSQIYSTVANYMSTAGATIRSRLAPTSAIPLVVQAGVELRQSADLTLSDPLDLTAWHFDGQPVALTVRAGGTLSVLGTVSDGLNAGPSRLSLGSVPSATIRLIGGADSTSADPLAVQQGVAADLILGGGVAIRTGTGDISVKAARDVTFSPASVVFTAGLPGVPTKTAGSFVFDYPTQGGRIDISAGRDLAGSPVTQSVTAWQTRQTRGNRPVEWGVNLANFGWNVGAFGGGDVTLNAGRDITEVSVASADSRAVDLTSGAVTRFGGGGLAVNAGRDVASGQFFVARGTGVLDAGGSFSAQRQISNGDKLGSLLYAQDADLAVSAHGDINLEGVLNPTAVLQPAAPGGVAYFSYGDQSRLRVRSTGGNIALVNNNGHLAEYLGGAVASGSELTALEVLPASLVGQALQGDVRLTGAMTLYPSDGGQLDLFAGRDIIGTDASIYMSDAAPSDIPTALALRGTIGNIQTTASSARHRSDGTAAVITAGRDIVNLNVSTPKSTRLMAGRDIVNLRLASQNLNPWDVTLISAGRDFLADPTASTAQVSTGGPGKLDVLAGRNVDLGFSSGLITLGSLANANLPVAKGADLTVFAGLGASPDYAAFLDKVIAPSEDYRAQLVKFVESRNGTGGLSFEEARQQFLKLDADAQRPLTVSIFFSELVKSGREANTTPKLGFANGYTAIDALFPNSRTALGSTNPSLYAGDLTMAFSRIYTLAGGNISLLVPGGLVNVGVSTPPEILSQRPQSELGIVAQGAGSVNIYSKGDVLVNSSRIFTLQGGDIAVWSTEGNIDAGRGAKSAVSAPPPSVQVDSNGKVTLDFKGAVAGSGIRTIATDPSIPPGNVDLDAPVGFVNAGDAGIGSAGNINIAAQQVIGLDNINFGGASTGVPSQVNNLGASLSGVSSTAASTTNTSASTAAGNAEKESAAAPLAQNALSWLDVFVTGLGEENCKQDDVECLKRQRTKRP